jgi:hypothetical protein
MSRRFPWVLVTHSKPILDQHLKVGYCHIFRYILCNLFSGHPNRSRDSSVGIINRIRTARSEVRTPATAKCSSFPLSKTFRPAQPYCQALNAEKSFHREKKRNLILIIHISSLFWDVSVKPIAPNSKGQAVILVGLLDI